MNSFSDRSLNRREFLARNAMGVGGLALAWMLRHEQLHASPAKVIGNREKFDLKPRSPDFPPQAKAMISLFMHGGPSHVDLFDP